MAAAASHAERDAITSAPVKIVEMGDDGVLRVTKQGADFLESLGDRPVAPVSIAGPFRLGKSYLANRLLDHEAGFDLGHEIVGCTRGMWAWTEHVTLAHGGELIVLDTEGLYDTKKTTNKQRDAKILGFAILASSMFVFNLAKRVDAAVLDMLRCASTLFTEDARATGM
jgi:hypothetical protein